MPKVHSLAYVYLYEQADEHGLVRCRDCPYPLIPKVPPMKRAAAVVQALKDAPGRTIDDAYIFAVARSYMAEKFIRCKPLHAVHISVLTVEKKINPHYLQPFDEARTYFGLPACYLYRDTSLSRFARIHSVAVTRVEHALDDGDAFDLPPAYSRHHPASTAAAAPSRPHCRSCTCGAQHAPVAPLTPLYDESELERAGAGDADLPTPPLSPPLSPLSTLSTLSPVPLSPPAPLSPPVSGPSPVAGTPHASSASIALSVSPPTSASIVTIRRRQPRIVFWR